MLDLATATRAQFEACLGNRFELQTTTGPIALTLAEARPLGTARTGTTREPFALTFHSDPAQRLPQQIYHLEHPTLGALEIFLVPIAAGQFEAVFN